MMDDHTPPGGAGEEEALRSLLRGAVEGLQPSAGALERLRYAVPARRVRRRRAFVGAAAVVLLAGAAVPAVLHMAGGEGAATDHPAMAGHGAYSGGKPGAVASDPHQNGSGAQPKSSHSVGGAPAVGGATGQPDAALGGSPVGGLTAGPSGTGASVGSAGSVGSVVGSGPLPPVAAPGVPGCGADQLGVVGSARSPETDGRVYGSFRVTNVSVQGCAVTGRDTVAASAAGAPAGPGSAVAVVGHTAGDPASGLLPDPSAEASALVLPPNTSYEVRFAWVPSGEPCAATKPDAGANPPQTDSAGTSGGAANGAASEPQTGAAPAPPGVAVSHTPQTGAATTRTTIPEVCGGTVYRTGAIPLDD